MNNRNAAAVMSGSASDDDDEDDDDESIEDISLKKRQKTGVEETGSSNR